jgi:polygalacturonase
MGNTANHGLDGVLNVRAFGAVGDGVTDDRASIQQAIHAVSVAGGGVVYLPPGSWRLGGLSPSRVG